MRIKMSTQTGSREHSPSAAKSSAVAWWRAQKSDRTIIGRRPIGTFPRFSWISWFVTDNFVSWQSAFKSAAYVMLRRRISFGNTFLEYEQGKRKKNKQIDSRATNNIENSTIALNATDPNSKRNRKHHRQNKTRTKHYMYIKTNLGPPDSSTRGGVINTCPNFTWCSIYRKKYAWITKKST